VSKLTISIILLFLMVSCSSSSVDTYVAYPTDAVVLNYSTLECESKSIIFFTDMDEGGRIKKLDTCSEDGDTSFQDVDEVEGVLVGESPVSISAIKTEAGYSLYVATSIEKKLLLKSVDKDFNYKPDLKSPVVELQMVPKTTDVIKNKNLLVLLTSDIYEIKSKISIFDANLELLKNLVSDFIIEDIKCNDLTCYAVDSSGSLFTFSDESELSKYEVEDSITNFSGFDLDGENIIAWNDHVVEIINEKKIINSLLFTDYKIDFVKKSNLPLEIKE